jgi:hypothetical protein
MIKSVPSSFFACLQLIARLSFMVNKKKSFFRFYPKKPSLIAFCTEMPALIWPLTVEKSHALSIMSKFNSPESISISSRKLRHRSKSKRFYVYKFDLLLFVFLINISIDEWIYFQPLCVTCGCFLNI